MGRSVPHLIGAAEPSRVGYFGEGLVPADVAPPPKTSAYRTLHTPPWYHGLMRGLSNGVQYDPLKL